MLKNLAQRAKTALTSSTAKKVGLAVGGVALAGAGAYGAYKFFKGRKGARSKTSSPAKLRNQVMKIALKIKKMQLTNKLRKEQMKVSL